MDPMYISITASQATLEESAKVEAFLAEFLQVKKPSKRGCHLPLR
jgi:hypothetical protein